MNLQKNFLLKNGYRKFGNVSDFVMRAIGLKVEFLEKSPSYFFHRFIYFACGQSQFCLLTENFTMKNGTNL